MRLRPGDPAHIEHLQERVEQLLAQDWSGHDGEELARELRKIRLEIKVSTTAYQAHMRELQQARAS